MGANVLAGHTLPVFFSGALTHREGTFPPYFSGANLGSQLGVPYMAVSDPTLNLSDELGLAWYAGYEGGDVQDSIYQLLSTFTRNVGTHLLLAGGSGGGFAAMYYGDRLGKAASTFVWNPQTSISHYAPESVRSYFAVAVPGFEFDSDAFVNEAKLTEIGISSKNDRFRGHRLLYLQNYNDWHVRSHLGPFLENSGLIYRGNGLYSNAQNQAVVVSAFGEGHAVPNKEIILTVLKEMLNPHRSVRVIYNELIATGTLPSEFSRLPLDLRESWGKCLPASVTAETDAAKQTVKISLTNMVEGFGGVTLTVSLLKGGARVAVSGRSGEIVRVFDWVEFDAVKVDFHDGFGHPLGSLTVRTDDITVGHESSRKSRVFVYGSCVSRDAFGDFDGLELADYVSRSAMGSAFSRPPGSIPSIDIMRNPSSFQRRMVKYDLEKSLTNRLKEEAFDLLLLDFIDERLPLVRVNGTYITYSPEVQRCGFAPQQDSVVTAGSEDYFALFERGFEALLEIVDPTKICVSRAYWAEGDDRGNPLEEARLVDLNNRILDRLYDIAGTFDGIRFISYEKEHIVGDSGHKWGTSPFHYVADFYKQTRSALRVL
ncbi:DUF6270 domain-containing protein [Arthrobacter sp. Edens01]|uniref:DUF6270 domain-containing protein n=1 Tax=Arthrobacter sp. Edens01 TaxID=1732020 RepID=UPI00128F089F|nr:DUF6270 domain-containing protein [Arthrobacter sp. Edens01]